MLNYYNIYYKTLDKNGDCFWTTVRNIIDYEENIKDKELIKITWDNVEEIYQKYYYCLPFEIWKIKKGIKLLFYDDIIPKCSWKKLYKLNISLLITTEIDTPSLKELLEYNNSDKAIQYITERQNEYQLGNLLIGNNNHRK